MSSIKSPDREITKQLRNVPWILTWTVSVVLVLTSLAVAESAWRLAGYRPSVVGPPYGTTGTYVP